MTQEEEIKSRAIQILWNNGFSIGSIMHLFGLTRKQARAYIFSDAVEKLITKRREEQKWLLTARSI